MFLICIPLCLLVLRFATADDSCPLGFTSSGETCIRPILHPETTENAQTKCEKEGGQLFDQQQSTEIEDVADVLNLLFKRGILESTWLISPVEDEPRALSRRNHSYYAVEAVSASAAFPFVCSLTSVQRRTLLYQQQLIPKGAPRFVSSAPSEVYFHPRNGADFLPLSCSVESDPLADIQWYRNDVELISLSSSNYSYLLSGGTLLVPAVPSLAYSTFHCVAGNKYGKVRGPSILLKPAFLDAFSTHRSDVLPLADGGAILPCHAPNHQPKSLSFSWLVGTSDRVVRQSGRVLISLDGSLLLSHVDPDDDDRYACALSLLSTQSGHYGPFFRLKVTGAQATFAPRMHPEHPKIFPETHVVGDTVYLECFAFANPTPVYKWSRTDGRPLPSQATVTNFGRVLRIENALHSDMGRYKCTSVNSVGETSAEVTLHLRDTPTVLFPLSDRLVASKFPFSLDCPLSTADQSSSVEWFKDSKPIVPPLMPANQRKRFRVDRNKLHVSSADVADSGVYQCMVSNEIGVSTSSAHIYVHDSAPMFPSQAMPVRVYAVKGTNLSIPCMYQASPRGHSQWTDAGGSRIPRNGRVRDHQGSLVIHNVLDDDAGLFFCTAHNRLGKAHSQVHLTVLDSPRVHISSVEKGVARRAMNISCEIEMECPPSQPCPEAMIQWTENDRPVQTTNQYRSKVYEHSRNNDRDLFVNQKVDLEVPRDENGLGRFACSSILGGTSVEVARRQLPPAPISLHAEKESQGIRLSWRMPPQHRETRDHTEVGGVNGYLIEMRTRAQRGWRAAPRNVVGKSEADGFLMENLEPNMPYQFRLRSLDASSIGDPSSPSEWVHTHPSVPNASVDGVRWRPLDPSTLLVEWNPIEQKHQSGKNLRYRVSWSEGSADSKGRDFEPSYHAHYIDSKHSQAVVHLNSSRGCRAVTLAVRPINDEGPAPSSTNTVALLSSTGKVRDVRLVDVFPLNATHVNITWVWEEENDCHTTHAIEVACSDDTGVTVSSTISADVLSWLHGGFQPDTQYNCHIRPFDVKGHYGKASNEIGIRTKQNPPRKSPTIRRLSLKPLADESGYTTVLEWTAVELQHGNLSEDSGYKIFIFISETASDAVVLSMPFSRLIDQNSPSARLDGLRLMYMYTIQVAGYNSGGLGPLSPPRSIRLGSSDSYEKGAASNHICITLITILMISVFFSL